MKCKKPIVITFWILFCVVTTVRAQDQPTGDSLSQGLWWLYQLQYTKARELFYEYTKEKPDDPAGYFYKTAADWWQLAQEFDQDLPEIKQRLDEDYQMTVKVANTLLESAQDPKTKGLANLYSGGAEGLMGRWLVTQHQWLHAYFMGKSGHRKLLRALAYDPDLFDAYLGLGIYDYFTDTLPGAQGVLAAMFIHGDRKRGLKELQWAIEKGEHSRVEAMMFLIEIYTWEEHAPEKALPLAQQMHQELPESPAMYLAEIMDYYELNQWDKVAECAQDYLTKSEQEIPYYRREGVSPARYCLGVAALLGRHDADTCLKYMNEILADGITSSRWVTFAYLRLGQVYDLKGDRQKALDYYNKVLERPHFWGSYHEAHAYLNEPYKF
jgi:hypothetical protein